MTSTAEAKRAVQDTVAQLGGIDIVISNAVCPCSPVHTVKLIILFFLCKTLVTRTGLICLIKGLDTLLRLERS